MSSEFKVFVGIVAFGAGIFMGYTYSYNMRQKYIAEENQKAREHELLLKEKESKMPPEYWTAKAAEHEASIKKEELDIQSRERLTIDQRNREDAERQAIREFEKSAPAEYWEQKRVMEEQKTKREADQRRYEAEREAAKLHNKAIEESARAAERAIKQSFGSYPGYTFV